MLNIKILDKPETCACDVVEFMYEYVRKFKKGSHRSRCKCDVKKFDTFCKSQGVRLMSNEFDDVMAQKFVSYLRGLNLMQTTVACTLRVVKGMFRRMHKRGYAVNFAFDEVQVKPEKSQEVYLTMEEVERLRALKIVRKTTRNIRDLFVIGCYTGLRFGDYSTLTPLNIIGDTIVKKTKKTGAIVRIPIHPVVREILDTNMDCLVTSSVQNFNSTMKRLCKQVGIDDEILWERTVGRKVVRKRVERYKLVGSHTARRTFATNAYLAGVPAARIMLITGHKTEGAFFDYIRITAEENVEFLAKHPFFTKN